MLFKINVQLFIRGVNSRIMNYLHDFSNFNLEVSIYKKHKRKREKPYIL